MSAEYAPGTVAVATVLGVPNVRVMAGYGTAEPKLRWLTTDDRLVDSDNDGWYFSFQVTDVRPLVVIDTEDVAQIERLYGALHARVGMVTLHEALTSLVAPPKPDEPIGLGAVVEDAEGLRWVQARDPKDSEGAARWRSWPIGMWKFYSDIDAVRVLSEGVTA